MIHYSNQNNAWRHGRSNQWLALFSPSSPCHLFKQTIKNYLTLLICFISHQWKHHVSIYLHYINPRLSRKKWRTSRLHLYYRQFGTTGVLLWSCLWQRSTKEMFIIYWLFYSLVDLVAVLIIDYINELKLTLWLNHEHILWESSAKNLSFFYCSPQTRLTQIKAD